MKLEKLRGEGCLISGLSRKREISLNTTKFYVLLSCQHSNRTKKRRKEREVSIQYSSRVYFSSS